MPHKGTREEEEEAAAGEAVASTGGREEGKEDAMHAATSHARRRRGGAHSLSMGSNRNYIFMLTFNSRGAAAAAAGSPLSPGRSGPAARGRSPRPAVQEI